MDHLQPPDISEDPAQSMMAMAQYGAAMIQGVPLQHQVFPGAGPALMPHAYVGAEGYVPELQHAAPPSDLVAAAGVTAHQLQHQLQHPHQLQHQQVQLQQMQMQMQHVQPQAHAMHMQPQQQQHYATSEEPPHTTSSYPYDPRPLPALQPLSSQGSDAAAPAPAAPPRPRMKRPVPPEKPRPTSDSMPSLPTLAKMGKVDAPPIQMSSQLEALYQYIKEQDDEEAEPYGENFNLPANQLAQRVREMEALSYRLSLEEDREFQKAADLKIFASFP